MFERLRQKLASVARFGATGMMVTGDLDSGRRGKRRIAFAPFVAGKWLSAFGLSIT